MQEEGGLQLGMGTALSSQQLSRWARPITADRRGHSLHLPFLYSPTHYDKHEWETQIPASKSGDAGGHKGKGKELLHRAPGLSLGLVSPLLLSAPGPAFQALLRKRQLQERPKLRQPLACEQSAEVPSSGPGGEREPVAPH